MPFKITERASGKPIATLDAEQVGNRGIDALWSPDSQFLVVLTEWRHYTALHFFRWVGGRFEHSEIQETADADFLELDRWIAPRKVQLYGDGEPLTLVITNHAAKFAP